MKNDKEKGLLWGALLGDAYSVTNATLNFEGSNTSLATYHSIKKAGDFTHYGDQTVWLLEHIDDTKTYDPFNYAKIWQAKMNHYEGYIDSASKTTLKNLNDGTLFMGSGSNSDDLSVIGRHAPIIFGIKNMDEIVEFVKFHTFLTHMNKDALDASKYIVEVVLAMIYNLDVETTLKERAAFYGDMVKEEVHKAFKLRNLPCNEAINSLGASCSVKGALASTVYLIINYHDNFEALLKANVLSGGDSVARGMVAGMVVGARYGFEAIKPSWIEELNTYEKLNGLIL